MQVREAVSSREPVHRSLGEGGSPVVSEERNLTEYFATALQRHFFPSLTTSSSLKTGDWRLDTALETPFAIALSGGADSMALTLLAADWARAHGASIVTLTVDHGLRAESADEAATVAGWMKARGIAHHILTPTHRPAGNNLMQAARQWRYDALVDFCRAHGITHCLLGHHLDDQLETVALAHLRGNPTLMLDHERSAGEAGMPAQRDYRGVALIRPLLEVSKAALVAFLRARDVAWVEDPTNCDPRFARTRVRSQLATDPAFKAALQVALAARQASHSARENALAMAMPRCVTFGDTTAMLDLAEWKMLVPELRSLMLANLVRRIGGKPHRPRRHETLRLAAALLDEPSGKRTLGHCLIRWKTGGATIRPEQRD